MSDIESERGKYKVSNPGKLSSWKKIAQKEIYKYLTDESYQEYVYNTTLSKDENPPGPFTRFLYHFAYLCECGWGVMVDFNEHRQRVHLTNKYYKWMHELRDEMLPELEKLDQLNNTP